MLSFAVLVSTAAQAEVFTYQVEGNHRLSVGGGPTTLSLNTATGQGSVVGGNINATFTGDFSNFKGGETPDFSMFEVSNLQGTRNVNGNTLNPTDQSSGRHQYKLILDGEGGVNLWANWGENAQYGDYLAETTGYTAPSASSTSTGGLTSTGGVSTSSSSTGGITPTGGSTGGTDVPAPGALLLMGLGLAGLAIGSRRRKR